MNSDTLVYIFFVLFLIAMAYFIIRPVRGLANLSPRRFEDEMNSADGATLIDVRESHEYVRGHIPGAVNIPLSQLGSRLDSIPEEQKVLLYCQSGMRSKRAAKLLSKHGYRNMGHLSSGIMAWGGPLEKK